MRSCRCQLRHRSPISYIPLIWHRLASSRAVLFAIVGRTLEKIAQSECHLSLRAYLFMYIIYLIEKFEGDTV